jgi:uncharacterized integral membrane protein
VEPEHEPAQTPPVEPAEAAEPERPAAEAEHSHEPEPPVKDASFRPSFWAKLLTLLFFFGYSIAFIVGNDKTISVDFVFATARVSLIWTILLLLAVGIVAGALFSGLYRHRRSKQRRQS